MRSHTLCSLGILSLLVAANTEALAAGSQYGQTTYIPSTIPNTDVWPLGGAQYDGIDLDTCLQKAQAEGFHFASYTAGRLPINSRCNLYTQSTTAAVGGVTYNTDWELISVGP